jgi:hypothetical protein
MNLPKKSRQMPNTGDSGFAAEGLHPARNSARMIGAAPLSRSAANPLGRLSVK